MTRPASAVLVAMVRPTPEGLAFLWHALTGQRAEPEEFRVLLDAARRPEPPR